MKLKYPVRSSFRPAIETALADAPDRPLRVAVALPPGKYNRSNVLIGVERSDPLYCESDWKGDPTRCCARIRAAAWVLHSAGYEGRYRMSHRDGLLEIEEI